MRAETGERNGTTGPEATPLLDEVRRFVGPRFPGGSGERAAGDEVAAAFAAAGLDVSREPFRTGRSAVFRLQLIGHAVGALTLLAMALTSVAHPGAAALLGAAGLLHFAVASRWPRRLEGVFDLGPMIDSENVTARRPGSGRDPVCVVVMAHRDTKSSRWPTFVPAVVLLLAVAFLLAATALTAAAWGRGQPGPALMLSAVGVAVALLALPFNRSGDESPGAMDNASGVAVLLAAARTLPQDGRLDGAELRFVCTGAEEIGLAGALHWIRRHGEELPRARTVIINVDSVGVGHGLLAADTRGYAPGGRSMTAVVRAAAGAAGAPLRVLSWLPAAGVDSMPISSRGFATVTLLGRVLGRAAMRIHTRHDTVDHLNERGLEHALRVVGEIARHVVTAAPR